MENSTLIKPDDTWVLWTFLVAWAAFSIYSEQRFKWAEKISGPLVCLLGGLIAANTGIVPTRSPVYDVVLSYIVPLCIPLLLLKCDLRKIWRETGRMMGAFHVSSLGTILGAFAAAFILGGLVSHLDEVCGIMTASYIGGSINFVACINIFRTPESITNALVVADNLVMAVHIMAMIALPGLVFAVRWFGSLPDEDLYGSDGSSTEDASDYWRPKPISLLDIGKNLALAFIIVTLSTKLSNFILGCPFNEALRDFLGNRYLLFTTLTMIFVLLFPNFSSRLSGTREMGTFAIYLFFVLIGIPASIKAILLEAPILFILCSIMVLVNVLVTFGLGKIFGYSVQEMSLVSVANIAGPMNVAAIAITKKWSKLVLPGFLVGIWGYIIGTYMGVIVREILRAVL